jgi:hypothetical protein
MSGALRTSTNMADHLAEAGEEAPQTPGLELFGTLDDLTIAAGGDVTDEPTLGYCVPPACVRCSSNCGSGTCQCS